MNTEHLVVILAAEIDHDEPPGLAAHQLARAALCLIRNRDGAQAVLLETELNKLHPKYPRPDEELVSEGSIPLACESCHMHGIRTNPKYICEGGGQMWLECENHSPTDNPHRVLRTKRELPCQKQ